MKTIALPYLSPEMITYQKEKRNQRRQDISFYLRGNVRGNVQTNVGVINIVIGNRLQLLDCFSL